MESVK